MKTKHLFYTLALSAAFAACSQEEIVSQQEVAKVDLGNRPTVGNVTLNFGEAESRGTVADRAFNAIDFVKGEDGFGARIIDVYKGFTPTAGYTLDHASRKYEVVNEYASSNYKYVNNGGTSWTTDALMVEGNYMFYYPYNQANLARTPNKVVLPLAQTVKPNEADGYRNPIKDLYEGTNPAIVGYTFLSATDQDANVSPALHHIFAYPQITLENNYKYLPEGAEDKEANYVGKTLTITKILLKSKMFHAEGEIKHEGLVKSLRDFSVAAVANTNMGAIAAGTWNANTKEGIYSATTEYDTTDGDGIVDWGTDERGEGTIEVTFEGGLALAPEASYSFNIVAPAGVYADESKIEMTVYLSNDKMLDCDGTKGEEYIINGLTFAPSKRYPTEAYNFPTNGTPSVKDEPATLATVEFTKNAWITNAKDPAELIDDIAEFEAFLKTIPNNTTGIEEINELSSTMTATQFVLARNAEGVADMKINAAVVELVKKYLNSGSVTFCSDMQVEDSENAVSLNKMTFNGKLNILAGEVTATGITADDITVTAGTLTIPANSTSELKNVVVEGGEVVVKKDGLVDNNKLSVKVTKKMNDAGTAVVSTGKLTIDTEATNTNFNYITMDAGEVEIAEESKAWYTSGSTNLTGGTITVNGELYVYDDSEIASGVTVDLYGDVTFGSSAELTNKGTINNYSDLVVTNVEGGTVNMKVKTAELTAHGEGGEIYNTIEAYVKVENAANDRDAQTVWYEIDEDIDFTTANSINFKKFAINALVIKGKTFVLDGTTEEYDKMDSPATHTGLGWINIVKLEDGSKIYADDAKQAVGMTKFIVEGDVEVDGFGDTSAIKFMKNTTIEMAKQAELTITKGMTLNTDTGIAITFTCEATAAADYAKVVNNGAVKGLASAGVPANITWEGNEAN